MADVDDGTEEQVALDESQEIAAISNLITENLPQLKFDNKDKKPLGHGYLQYEDLDYEMLVSMQWQHQTRQAALGIRNKKPKEKGDGTSIRQQTIVWFHEALKVAQDEIAIGTGKEREARWRQSARGGTRSLTDGLAAPVPASGNAYNANVNATIVAQKVFSSHFIWTL